MIAIVSMRYAISPEVNAFGGSNASGANTIYFDVRQTPGPLPLLGAGAAFGFSRKLRCRIRSSRAQQI